MLSIEYLPRVYKQLKKIPKAEQKKVLKKIELLAENPHAGKSLQGEYKGLFSLRAWPYRVIYQIRKKALLICSIKHRQETYKN